jgi:hypothetical protein
MPPTAAPAAIAAMFVFLDVEVEVAASREVRREVQKPERYHLK